MVPGIDPVENPPQGVKRMDSKGVKTSFVNTISLVLA
jgi:hypothetical protein